MIQSIVPLFHYFFADFQVPFPRLFPSTGCVHGSDANAGANPAEPRAGRYITAQMRLQWERQRGNCALRAALRPCRRLTLNRRALQCDIRSLGQETGIVGPEHRPAKANGGVDLRLPERPLGIAGVA